MPGMAYLLAEDRVVERVASPIIEEIEDRHVVGDPEGPHRVPHADEVQVDVPVGRVPVMEGPCVRPLRRSLAITLRVRGLDPRPGVRVRKPREVQEPASGNHASQAPRRERAAAETDEEQPIPRLVLPPEPAVGAHDVLVEAHPETAPGELLPPGPIRADTGMVVLELRVPGGITIQERVEQPHDVRRHRDAPLFLVRGIPGAITADHKIAHGASPPCVR